MPNSKCPFCASDNLLYEFGKSNCLDCLAEYEFDDKSECIFASINDFRLPQMGAVCPHCGLLQGMDMNKCILCRTTISCAQR